MNIGLIFQDNETNSQDFSSLSKKIEKDDDNYFMNMKFLPMDFIDSQSAFEKFFLEDEQEFNTYIDGFWNQSKAGAEDPQIQYQLYIILDHMPKKHSKRDVLFFGTNRSFWICLSFADFAKSNSNAKESLSKILDQISLILELGASVLSKKFNFSNLFLNLFEFFLQKSEKYCNRKAEN